MKEKTKLVTIEDTRYQIGRFTADVGSWILGRTLNAGARDAIEKMKALGEDFSTPSAQAAPSEAPDVETQIRRMTTSAFGAMAFEERSTIQRKCIEKCARMEGPDGNMPMPLANGNGTIRGDVAEDLQLVLRLEMEVLIFNFSDFFEQGGFNALLSTPAPKV
jgi:hypothetical protein